MRALAAVGRSNRSMPQMLIAPLVGARLPVSICIVVVLPAPFGPRNPRISPRFNSMLTLLTAVRAPNLRESPWAETVNSAAGVGIRGAGREPRDARWLVVGVKYT